MARLLSVVVLGFAALVSAELGWKNVSPEKAPGAPRNRYAHASAVHGNSILITHGYFYDNQRGQMGKQTWMDDTWLYNPKSGWEQVHTTGPVPDPRYGHTFERIGDQFYLFGGDDGTVKESPNNFIPNPHEDLWRLSLSTKTWEEIPKSGKWPKARASHAAWVHDGKMYIFGGYQGHSDLWKFDPETNEWQEIVPKGDHPGVRFSIEAVVPEGADTAYIFGGYRQGNANMQDLWGFHIPTSKWTMIRADGIVEGHVPRKRGAYALAPHGSMFYMFAGAECQPVCTCYNDVWIFDPESALWEEIDVGRRKPPTRYKHSMNVLPDGTALIFGGEGYRFVSDYHNDVWQLGPVDALAGWRLFGLFALALVVAIYVAVKMFSAKSTKKGGYSQLMSDGLQGDSKLN